MRIAWTDLALDRVEESALHIAADDPVAARRWADELFAAVEQLARFPESGRLVPELEGRRVRELIYGAYRVFYRVDAGGPHPHRQARKPADPRGRGRRRTNLSSSLKCNTCATEGEAGDVGTTPWGSRHK